ncbi:MAG: hypothetical protein COB33_008405 [Thiotrichaceae bacterium]|nr:hypothetical protein [Thiotrichaceae bacterium]
MKKQLSLPSISYLMLPLWLSGSLHAAPGTLDQTPLYVGPAVEPNIVILSDDSGSMGWEIMSLEHGNGDSSSATMAFNTTTLVTGAVIYQARFNPSEDWKGELIATRLNANGTIAATPEWNSGTQLNNQAHANRQIITYNPGTGNGIRFKTLTDLTSVQQNDLNMGLSAADTNGQARLDYLRGDRSNESTGLNFRERTNVLGDIIHSNPVFVGKPQMNYPDAPPFGDDLYSVFKTAQINRTGIVYIGANDGMLHGFHEDTGNEVFAYIPNALFSNATGKGLHYLTDPGYTHRYYVDLSPTIADVHFNSAWRTVLVGGLRAGGRGLFALDITHPTTLTNAENNAASIVLWEFTSADDDDLGYTMSKPTIAMMENNQWGVVFGNGYNGSGDGEAKLFILNLEDGLDGSWASNGDYQKITTGIGTRDTPNGLSTPQLVDTDGNGKVDRAYAGDLRGNLWAFDLSGNRHNWKVAYSTTGPTAPKPLFTATDADDNPQPITSKPVIAKQRQAVTGGVNLMVFLGTGQYLINDDKTSTSRQSFYGIWDADVKALTRSHLVAQTFTTDDTATGRVLTNNAITYSSSNVHGWYIDLPTRGERMVVNPKIRGSHVFFNTLIPGTELRVPQSYGWLMVAKQENGGKPDMAIFDVNNDGVINASDDIGGHNASGVAPGGIPAAQTFFADNMYTSDDEGNIDIRKISIGDGGSGGRLSWLEITQQ